MQFFRNPKIFPERLDMTMMMMVVSKDTYHLTYIPNVYGMYFDTRVSQSTKEGVIINEKRWARNLFQVDFVFFLELFFNVKIISSWRIYTYTFFFLLFFFSVSIWFLLHSCHFYALLLLFKKTINLGVEIWPFISVGMRADMLYKNDWSHLLLFLLLLIDYTYPFI